MATKNKKKETFEHKGEDKLVSMTEYETDAPPKKKPKADDKKEQLQFNDTVIDQFKKYQHAIQTLDSRISRIERRMGLKREV
tara:strand:+ start:1918 stop:2163 length:246 start_codon:yes stop_codon:yes gene_type:complete